MYDGFKFFKRNPTVYDPALVGSIFVSYLAFSTLTEYLIPQVQKLEERDDPHAHDYNERLRQYNRQQSNFLRNQILQLRAERDQQQQQEAQQ